MARVLYRSLYLLLALIVLQRPGQCLTGDSPPPRPPAIIIAARQERILDRFVTLSKLEAALFADAADGRLDDHSLLAAALIAGGVDDAQTIAAREEQMAVWTSRLRSSGTASGRPRERLKAIFEFMHREMLYGGYRLDASDLSVTFDEGRFNCVSASVLFCCLCERFGIMAEGLEIPGHAMVRVVLADEELEVEATCPQWFSLTKDPRRREELIEKTLGRSPAGSAGGSGGAGGFRRVSGVQLVATIYYNRGVDLLSRKQFAAAMAANCKAVRLDRDNQTAWGNLLATLNNWAVDAGAEGRFADAVTLLETGLDVDPNFQAFTGNYTHVHHLWVESLCRLGRHEEALKHLAAAARRRPDEPWFLRAKSDVYRHWTETSGEKAVAGKAE